MTTKRLSHVEEIELCKEAQKGCEKSLEKMVTHNLGLVNKISRKMYFKNEQFSYEDLFQEGVIGLMKAISKFDPTEGCRFSTYSYYWIYCYIGRYNENHRGRIRIPSHITEKLRKYEKTSDPRLNELRSSIPHTVSLNKMIGENSSMEDVVPTTEVEMYDEVGMMLDEIRSLLTEKEYDIICKRYGIDGHQQMTQRECAKVYDVSHSAIYLIEKKVMVKLKKHFLLEV